jgi:HSP20 family molecular chaperone IbpA
MPGALPVPRPALQSKRVGWSNKMAIWFKDFERVFDEFFEDALLSRWRGAAAGHDAIVRDCGDRYELELNVGVEPEGLEVEVIGNEIVVRRPRGQLDGRFRFSSLIDADAVQARWSKGLLQIIAPKRKSRRVPVEKLS